MAKKSRFYRIKTRNGYGPLEDWTVPARKRSLAVAYFRTADIDVYHAEHLGQVEVNTYADPSRGVFFAATVGGADYLFEYGAPGYEWLKDLFEDQFYDAAQELDD
ncbi:hypothetical protein C4K24_2108 [Pseudomonas chlororaphis subsp. aurantiaca]|uniref:Uncharacterized protein n=1 Tax=Pseudomonas chlororaphis subsp. aurantiaca TaxID=86192 RepID=A0AAJ0ZJB2_9PSED|nr:hypothetical protein [Pseudomonas chlororaphis]AZD21411.1 hypothetical protein C4K24_2108 [Pseudomonas chlororaphis subsp. aurantiaca]MBU4633418.1 hypothetical protein [Pseudomonas chlororaphis subsp. aurantiaca]